MEWHLGGQSVISVCPRCPILDTSPPSRHRQHLYWFIIRTLWVSRPWIHRGPILVSCARYFGQKCAAAVILESKQACQIGYHHGWPKLKHELMPQKCSPDLWSDILAKNGATVCTLEMCVGVVLMFGYLWIVQLCSSHTPRNLTDIHLQTELSQRNSFQKFQATLLLTEGH